MAFTIDLLRTDDLLNLVIECDNLQLDRSDSNSPALVPIDVAQPAFLIFNFPPQTIAEEAFFELSTTQPPPNEADKPNNPHPFNKPPETPSPLTPTLPVKARLGGPSRLVFRIPASPQTRIPYSPEGLLAWQDWELCVSPIADVPEEATDAQRANAPDIKQPGRLETALELPYRLILSPAHNVAWNHATQLKSHRGRVELWHTRLARRVNGRLVDFTRTDTAQLRAIWSPDYNPQKFDAADPPEMGKAGADFPVLTAMTPSDRHELVILTSAFHGFVNDDTSAFVPLPIHAEQLILSPLGGWLKSRGAWEPPAPWRPFIPFVDGRRWRDYVQLVRLAPGVAHPAEASGEEPHAAELRADLNLALRDPLGALRPRLFGSTGSSLNLSEWVHVATQGRDHYVRIVYEGHLYPFGHRAALIKVTERKFRDVNGTPVAYLVQHMFIVVREPLKDYTKAPLENDGRGLPLRNVRLTTLVTPDIANPYPPTPPLPPHRIVFSTFLFEINTDSFWVRLGTGASPAEDFKFHAVAEDIGGNRIDFTASLIFVPLSETHLDIVTNVYNTSGDERACAVPGQQVTYAARKAGVPDNTTLTTRALFFTTHDAPNNKQFGGFLPKLFKSEVNLPAVEQLLGTDAPTTISFYEDYLNTGFANATGLFAKIVKEAAPGQLSEDKIKSTFSADKAGGIATPDLALTGITRDLGPLSGDLTKAAQDNFDPKDFFKEVADTAKLFGTLPLTDLLLPGASSNHAPKVEFFAEPLPQGKLLVTTLNWEPQIQSALQIGILNFKKSDATTLTIKARLEKPVQASALSQEGKSRFSGELTDFTLDFLNVVALDFKSFGFVSETGKKAEVSVHLKEPPVKFQGDLAFVEELRQLIPPGLFGDGPSLDITTEHIKAGFAIALPPAAIGIFSLTNVSLAAFLELPFTDGKPLFDFGFATREHPFNLTVTLFGGGGFFHLQLDTDGMRQLEAAIEFGASATINLGVASGSVHIMAGIYFAMQKRKIAGKDVDAATLSGYLRLGGELSVLGLISISLEFVLSFTYQGPPVDKASGRATLTVKVEVLFFSKSVEVSVEKSFGGQGGDPTFAQLWDSSDVWDEYASAFAS